MQLPIHYVRNIPHFIITFIMYLQSNQLQYFFLDLLTSNHDEDRSGIVTPFSETDDKQSETSN